MIHTVELSEKYLEDAAKLFVESYARFRSSLVHLSPVYTSVETVVTKLKDMSAQNPGVAAISGSTLVGYIGGYAGLQNFKGISPGGYTPEWAHTARIDNDVERIYYPMHSALTKTWIERGYFTHAISTLPEARDARDYLYYNGYGVLVIDGIRGIDGGDIDSAVTGDIRIRPMGADDLNDLRQLDDGLYRHLGGPPTYLHSSHSPTDIKLSEFIADGTCTIVSERKGRVVGAIRARLNKTDCSDLAQSDGIIGIDFAYIEPDSRGTGASAAMLKELLAWGEVRGQTACAVDFESANFLGRKFWLRHFRPVSYSVIRHIDPRTRIK